MSGSDENHQRDMDKLKLFVSPAFPQAGRDHLMQYGRTTSKVSMLMSTHRAPRRLTSLPRRSATSCELPVSLAYRISKWSMYSASSSSRVHADDVARGELIF